MNKFIFGRVLKKKLKKIIVIVKKTIFLPIYNKKKNIFVKINAFDIYNESNFGDYVVLKKSRPIKKTIFWIMSKVLEKTILI